MDEKKWVFRNCRFAQTVSNEDEIKRRVFKALTEDPEARYTKADVTRSMKEMGFDPLSYPETVDVVMGMLNRWYQHRDELRRTEDRGGPNVGRIGQPPIPGRGY